jgi:lysophospholipase L1-like esterase
MGLMIGLGLGLRPIRREGQSFVPAPFHLAIYGDSFGQRGQDITGSPNAIDAGAVDPQLLKWATDLTSPVGGVNWGMSPWIDALSGGKFTAPYQINRAIGGFNTGQLARFDGADPTPWYLADFTAFLASQSGSVLAPDAVIYQAGTNDGVTTFSAASSYANILKACQKIVALGVPVFLSTVLPRGNAANTGSRLATDRIIVNDALNALLISNLAAEPSLNGMVRVIDPRASFRDNAGQSNDILDALVYDGLHLSVTGCRILAQAYLAALNAYFTAAVTGHLPTGATYIANGLMSGTAGVVTRTGNAATNTGFTISGVAPDGWTVTTSLNGGASAWNGTSPNNVTGTVTVGAEAADVGAAIVITAACNASGLTTANTRAIEAKCIVTLPAVGVLAVGEYFRGIVVVELSGHAGCRGVSAELRVVEPDAVLRTKRSNGPAPNGTANMTLDATNYLGAGRIVLQTPPCIRKAGSYGAIEFAVFVMFAGQVNPANAVVKISQAGVMKVL